MAEERIHFGQQAEYNAALALQHLVRYALVRKFCRGKRVLDVACGEGYGSFLMKSWGAREVIGVDNSGEAIRIANSLFSRKGIQFVRGDAQSLDRVLRGYNQFDLIVSFETIEHVNDSRRFVELLKQQRSEPGIVIISCPNDFAGFDPTQVNEYHVRKFTLRDFQELTVDVLGTADQWLIGTPLQGMVHYKLGSPMDEGLHDRAIEALSYRPLDNTIIIPSQLDLRPASDDCVHYVGIWGSIIKENAAVSAISYKAFVGPWRSAEIFQKENETLQLESQQLQIKNSDLSQCVAHLRSDLQVAKQDLEKLNDQKRGLVQEISDISEQTRNIVAEQHTRLVSYQQMVSQLHERSVHLDAELDDVRNRLSEWERFSASRSYRLTKMYYGLYGAPIFNRLLRNGRQAIRMLRKLS